MENLRASSETSSSDGGDMTIVVTSLNGGKALRIRWDDNPTLRSTHIRIILEHIMRLAEKIESVRLGLMKLARPLQETNIESYEQVRQVFDVYNSSAKTYRELFRGTTHILCRDLTDQWCSQELLTSICQAAYSIAVLNARVLNSHYTPWSNEVYGETKYEQMQKIIDQLEFKEHDVFLDMGSGVGQLVAYVAGGSKVRKAIGIEKSDLPAEFAVQYDQDFRKMMNWYNKKFRPYELFHGDFLDEQFRDLITNEATVIFINNYAFSPDLETSIKYILQDCRDGTRIVSTKAYANGSKVLSERLLGDIESIMDVRVLETIECPTSWTDKPVPYYLHTINNTKLARYFEEKKSGPPSQEISRRTSLSSKSSSSSRESSHPNLMLLNAGEHKVRDKEHGESEIGPAGRTTRRMWAEQCNKTDKRRAGDPPWDAPDTDYLPPKKIRKSSTPKQTKEPKERERKPLSHHRKPGRQSSVSRTKTDLDEEEMEARTLEFFQKGTQAMIDASLSASPQTNRISSGPLLPFSEDQAQMMALRPGEVILRPDDPVDHLLIAFRCQINEAFASLRSDEFLQEIRQEIEFEKARNEDLNNRFHEKETSVNQLVLNGVKSLMDRLRELGMNDVKTPGELLMHSKKIVAEHKELTMSVSARESEVANLEGRTRAAVPYGDALVERINVLDETADLTTITDRYTEYIKQIAVEHGYQPPPRSDPENDPTSIESPGGGGGPPKKRSKARSAPGRKGRCDEAENAEITRRVCEIVRAVKSSVNEQSARVEATPKEKERRPRATSDKGRKSSEGVPLPRNVTMIPSNASLGGAHNGMGGVP